MKKQQDNENKNQDNQEKAEEAVVNQEDFSKLKEDFENLQNQLKRAVADYQNLEKRVADGRSELANWATSSLLLKLLPVLGYFEKAINGASDEEKKSSWFKGIELAFQQLQMVLKDEGLEEIRTDPSTALGTGSQFDPAFHEAVDVKEMPPSLDSSGEPKDNMILEIAEKGYTLNGKVVKPAKVVVGTSRHSERSEESQDSETSSE